MSLSCPGSWKKDAVNSDQFDAWDYAMRKRLGYFAGLRFFERTNTSGINLVSRHWPHKLCWDWFITWQPYRKGYEGPRKFQSWGTRYGSTGIRFWLGSLHLTRQDSGHMGACGPLGIDAPKILWKHHIDTATFTERTRALSQ